jgi:hypothetical protein
MRLPAEYQPEEGAVSVGAWREFSKKFESGTSKVFESFSRRAGVSKAFDCGFEKRIQGRLVAGDFAQLGMDFSKSCSEMIRKKCQRNPASCRDRFSLARHSGPNWFRFLLL